MPPPSASPAPTGFDALPPTLRALAERGVLRRFRRGQQLIGEGERDDTLYIILAGRVRAFSRDEREREITYGVYGPGEYVGEMSLDGGPRSASVEALETVSAALVTRTELRLYIATQPDFAFELLSKVIRRARAATLSVRQLALNDVYGRLKSLLDGLADPADGGTRRLRERLTHQAMAHRLGCSREMVSRLMKDLSTGGYLATDGSTLVLLRELPARW